MLITLWVFFTFFLFLAYTISSKMVGAFERIINELDEVIEQKFKRTISARSNDQLVSDILQRINILIKNLPWPKKREYTSNTIGEN